jgi:tetratricopeptide (TPR) repeat protein
MSCTVIGTILLFGGHSVVVLACTLLTIAAGRLDAAADDAAHAVELAHDSAALEVAGWVAYYRRRYDEARSFAEEGVRRATQPALRVSCLALAGRIRHAAGDLAAASASLESAVDEIDTVGDSSLARVWLAFARLHQGRPADALATLPVVVEAGPHPFALPHARFTRVLALGQAGRVAEALDACDRFDEATRRSGQVGARFAGVAANCRAWLVRWTGFLDEADEHNRRAVELATPSGMEEARYAALLDLVDGRLIVGDAAGAAEQLERLATIEQWHGTMAWHQHHRYTLQRARVTLAAGERERAAALAAGVASDAAQRGARRYELLASAVAALAGGPSTVDAATVDTVVRGLDSCAALDGWWAIGALADAFGVDAWRRLADKQVARVAAEAPDAAPVVALASRLLPD